MNMLDLIIKKKNGIALSKEEIGYMIQDYTAGKIPDYQMSAMLMAVCFSGMDDEETAALTEAMTDSGDRLDLQGYRASKLTSIQPEESETRLP